MIVDIPHPDKVLFGDSALTKGDLAAYYEAIAPAMVPHVRDRPLSLKSFPGGIRGRGHFTKNIPGHFPDWIGRVTVGKHGGTVTHPLANDARTLVYLAGQNMIEPHVWTSRADRLDRPDRLIVDLDPPDGTSFADVRAVAREAGDVFRAVGLEPFAMTTGSRGIHVVAPLRRTADFSAVRELARALAVAVAAADPRRLTTEFHKDKREGRIYVDVLRNNYAQTAIPPYGVRAREGAPVATPLRWEELGDRDLSGGRWTIQSIGARLEHEGGDPWADIARHARDPGPVRRAVQRMAGDRDEA